jgi:hypothetical protein
MSDEQVDETVERSVPYARFQEVVARRNEAEAKLAEVESHLQAASEKGATADTLAQAMADLKAAHATELSTLQESLGLSRAGLNNPEGVAVARALYGAQPEDARPASLIEYIQQYQQEGDDVPAPPPGLAPYLQGASKEKPAEQKAERGSDLEQLRAYGSPRRRQGSAPGAPDVSVAAIREARARFARQPSDENAQMLRTLIRGA